VAAQITAKTFHPFLYWAVIIATTTAGTTMADFADRSLGIGYPGGSLILFALLMACLGIWYWRAGSISVDTVASPRIEMFYWTAILFSQTLGTALGDWMADSNGLGYERGALVFAAGLVVVAAAYFYTNVSRTLLFWGCLHPNAATGRDTGGFSRQTGCKWRTGLWSVLCLRTSCGSDCCLHRLPTPKGRQASRNTSGNLAAADTYATDSDVA
jgi:uncharacterized membrane-anchored protein